MLRIGEFARLSGVSPRTLRHYASLGLVEPASTDPSTGYRYYELGQLLDVHRVIALRDLGFGLEVIRELRDDNGDLPVERIRTMLRLRRAELAATIVEQSSRLERVEALLDSMEKGYGMRAMDVKLLTSERLRWAVADAVAPGYGHENLGPLFVERLPLVAGHLAASDVQPGISCAFFDWPEDDGRMVAHIGFDIGDQVVRESDLVRIVELEPTQVATVLHRGSMDGYTDTFLSVVRWIESNGYEIAERSRELYHNWTPQHPESILVELQIPVRSARR